MACSGAGNAAVGPRVEEVLAGAADGRGAEDVVHAEIDQVRALVDRQELIGRRLKAVADSLCDGSTTPLLQHLVEAQHVAPEDRTSLQELIDQWDEETKTAKRPRSS